MELLATDARKKSASAASPPIADFCNKICHVQTCRRLALSVA